jgi:hypothetical protein
MVAKIYFDEDAQRGSLLISLRLRSVDILNSGEAGMNGSGDREQLEFAARHERILFSYNVGDFSALHIEYLRGGKEHAGIVLAHQQQYGIGEQMRRLLHLTSVLTAEEMQSRLEFLSSWQEIT